MLSIRGVEIGLEAMIGPPFVCAIGVEDMLARAEEAVEPLGFSHTRPEIHDHALLLAINLFKDHVLPGASSVEDLARIARRDEFDARRFADRVREAGCTTIVHVVARHIAETRRDEPWSAIAILVPPRRRRYAERQGAARLRGEREPSELVLRLESRAASDGRLRSLAALAAAAVCGREFPSRKDILPDAAEAEPGQPSFGDGGRSGRVPGRSDWSRRM